MAPSVFRFRLSFGAASWVVLACVVSAASAHGADDPEAFFETRIRPVLADVCFRCHSDEKNSGGLRVDSRAALLKGGDSGPAIVVGEPDESRLVQAIRRDPDVSAMPPEKSQALRADQAADFARWIRTGAVWPARSKPFVAVRHWAFEPVRDSAPPAVRDSAWVRTGVDPFIRRAQEAVGAVPAPEADKRTLIRRATFDLTGLPPEPADVDAFLSDDSPDAYERVVERLLGSPAYGQRWGRHWLDVVRYADTAGETADYPAPAAWRYRNYVIDAFNRDRPYDQFLIEQIAGDVLAARTAADRHDAAFDADRYAEQVIATGFLAISRRFGFDSENYHHLTIQDSIDTLGQAVLGLSLGCARCHDHKFDAVTTADYYALYGIFDSSRYPFPGSEQKTKVRSLAPLVPPERSQAVWAEYARRVARLSDELARRRQPVPAVVLRSLHDLDGDFELQAAAAGGSNGVLVPPWRFTGKISVTAAAQSPYQNVYPRGRFGASVAAGDSPYAFHQTFPASRSQQVERRVHLNLDFRLQSPPAGSTASHRFTLGSVAGPAAFELHLGPDGLAWSAGGPPRRLGAIRPDVWQNVQLTIDLSSRTASGRWGEPGATTEFAARPLAADWNGSLDTVRFDSIGPDGGVYPAVEYDQLALLDAPPPPVSTEPGGGPSSGSKDLAGDTDDDPAELERQLAELTGDDGDLERQTDGRAPTAPWNPGPNSLVKAVAAAQSPFQNLYPPGKLGLRMPNRGEYDGFGWTLAGVRPDADGRLQVGFDFRGTDRSAGGDGTWRFYIGHGPGPAPAVELYFNGSTFFRRSGDEKERVAAIELGRWYQVQLTLDWKARSYTGLLLTSRVDPQDGKQDATVERTPFEGRFAPAWDGSIDYAFIDSYGHLAGVRPALDADNFVVRTRPLPPLDRPLDAPAATDEAVRRERAAALQRRLEAARAADARRRRELDELLSSGPFPLAYAMAEGTPQDARIQLRGEPDRPGAQVRRGFPKALGGGPLPDSTQGSGRLELARWLARPDHPLTARVLVNRVWHYHFGRGLVSTPNDFGVRGRAPTHPELLDHLAAGFVRDGWSIKALHRRIVGGATYRQASSDERRAADDGTYVGFTRRRLDAEEIRDAILAVSDRLDARPGLEHPFPSPLAWGFSQHAPFTAVYDHSQRSVYLMTQRLKRHPFLALFDGPDPNATTAARLLTTAPTQALYFLNDPFVHATSEHWAERLTTTEADDERRVDAIWRRAIGRSPDVQERQEAREFLTAYRAELSGAPEAERRALAAYVRAILSGNEFLYVD